MEAPASLWNIELTVFSEFSRNFKHFEKTECRRKNIEFNRSISVASSVPTDIHSRSIRFRPWKPLRHSEVSKWRFFLNLLEISDILRNYSFRWSSSSSIDPNWWQWKSPVISTRDPSYFVHGSPCVTPKYRIDGFFWIFSKFRIFWEIIVSHEDHRVQSIPMDGNACPQWNPLEIHPNSSMEAPAPLRNIELTVFSESSRNFGYFEKL